MVRQPLPETAPDENKSVLAAVLRRPLPKTILLDFFSHKSSMRFTSQQLEQQQVQKLEQQQVQQQVQQLEQQLERQPREGIKSHPRPPPSRNSLAQK